MRELTVFGNPTAKGRPRFNRSGRAYTDNKTVAAEAGVGWSWKDKYGLDPMQGDLSVTLSFHEGKHQQPQDLDNLIKLVLDALNEIAWHDDRQIKALTAMVERNSTEPRTWIQVRQMMPHEKKRTVHQLDFGVISG
jgi:Holliday junction resolvase RusA-like endonuclease